MWCAIVFMALSLGGHAASYTYNSMGSDWTGDCSTGTEQSPINIYQFVKDESNVKVSFSYNTLNTQGYFSDHNYQVDGAWGDMTFTKSGTGTVASAIQFHFHGPSENALNGYLYDLEMHIVHADANGNLFVIGVFYEEGDSSSFIESVISTTPTDINLMSAFGGATSLDHFYIFDGSLTTPPCSEGVQWTVWSKVQTLSKAQLKFFTDKWAGDASFGNGNGNNREIMPLNDRTVVEVGDYGVILAISLFLTSLI